MIKIPAIDLTLDACTLKDMHFLTQPNFPKQPCNTTNSQHSHLLLMDVSIFRIKIHFDQLAFSEVKQDLDSQKALAIAIWLRVAISGSVRKADPRSFKMSPKLGSTSTVSVLKVLIGMNTTLI